MQVKELLDKLKEMPEDAEVMIGNDWCKTMNPLSSFCYIQEHNEVEIH